MKMSTEMQKVETASLREKGYAIAKFSKDEFREIVQENLSNQQINLNDIVHVKMPSGGGQFFSVPSVSGDMLALKTLKCIILMTMESRGYWSTGIDEGGGGSPPDCASDNMVNGDGDPGGLCKDCPKNEFGSAKKGAGKACQEKKHLLLLPKTGILPLCLDLTPTSFASWKQYLVGLTSIAKPYKSVITEIGLVEATNKQGIKYSEATFKAAEMIDSESYDFIKAYAESITKSFKK
jgi:hypothetical protein